MMGYLEKLTFSKDWTNADDFPTYEPDESQVRADLQLLHDEAKDAINRLVEKLESVEFASHLTVSAEGLTATDLASALAELLETAQQAQAGTIVDGSIAEGKLNAALREKINGIDVTYSMNPPTANETPETGYALGKLWLKPAFAVENAADGTWSCENVTEEDGVFSGTGDSQYGSATAEVQSAAGDKVRVYLAVEETAGQFSSLKAYLNGAEQDLQSGKKLVQTVTAGTDGKVTVKVTADWGNTTTAAGGKFKIAAFMAVNETETLLPGATALTEANLDALMEAGTTQTRLELYGQQTAGVWKKLVPDENQTSDELTVTDAAAEALGLDAGATLSEALEKLKAYLDSIETVLKGGTAEGLRTPGWFAAGSYEGTGEDGAEHPNSLTFDFVPRVVEILGYAYTKNGSEVWVDCRRSTDLMYPVMLTERLTEAFVQGRGLQDARGTTVGDAANVAYGKKSADGKTVSWYTTGGTASWNAQFNQNGYRYYYSAMG